MNPYPLQLEISGPTALWARPDTLPNPVSYVDAFQRRLERGRWFYTPCLGCCPSPALFAGEGGRRLGEGGRRHEQRDNSPSAVPDYVGPRAEPKPLRDGEGWFRDGTAPCATENHVIPAFLDMVFNQAQQAKN